MAFSSQKTQKLYKGVIHMESKCCCGLKVLSFGLALGLVWAIVVFALGLSAEFGGYGMKMVDILESIYFGYTPSLLGSFIGAVWAFFDALIGGIVVAWVYNAFCKLGD